MNQTSLRAELRELLQEDVGAAKLRAQRAYDRQADSHGKAIVLFGAGGLGRKTLRGLRAIGQEPLVFCDSNSANQGRQIDGLDVVTPAEAARKFGDRAVFLVTIWGGRATDTMPVRCQQLRDLGCKFVMPFGFLFWKYPDTFLPHYPMDLPHKVLEARDDVLRAFDLWEDDASRNEYLAQIRWRLHLDFGALPKPVEHEIYFPDDLLQLSAKESFVDCGAFDGDTIESFLRRQGEKFASINAFEPDPTNFAKLAAYRGQLPGSTRDKISVHACAVGARSEKVRFDATGTEASVMGVGNLELDCVALDKVPAVARATWLKMDIEGAEPQALLGARNLIKGNTPLLAVCVYHKQEHVWEIPLIASEISPGYASHLRPHLLEGWDLVYYGVPRQRHS